MAALIELDAPQPSGVTILDVDKTTSDPLSEQPFDRLGHLSAGLPCPDHIDIAKQVQVIPLARGSEDITSELHVPQHGLGGIGCFQRSLKDSKSVSRENRIHARRQKKTGSFRIAATTAAGSSLSIWMEWSAFRYTARRSS